MTHTPLRHRTFLYVTECSKPNLRPQFSDTSICFIGHHFVSQAGILEGISHYTQARFTTLKVAPQDNRLLLWACKCYDLNVVFAFVFFTPFLPNLLQGSEGVKCDWDWPKIQVGKWDFIHWHWDFCTGNGTENIKWEWEFCFNPLSKKVFFRIKFKQKIK